MQKITVSIDTDGSVEISTSGFKGKACQEATRELERKLGKTTSDTPTAEMHQHADTKTSNRS